MKKSVDEFINDESVKVMIMGMREEAHLWTIKLNGPITEDSIGDLLRHFVEREKINGIASDVIIQWSNHSVTRETVQIIRDEIF